MLDAPRLIHALGGPRKVCELLGYDKRTGGVQRINNWLVRGIPSKVQLLHAALWLSAEQAAHELDRKKGAERPARAALLRPKQRLARRSKPA